MSALTGFASRLCAFALKNPRAVSQPELLVVVHTERGDNIRVISARRASKHERKAYEEAS
jgi:uncharacterized DUF497 family protein